MADDPFMDYLRDAALHHQMVYRAGMESRDDMDAARRRGWARRLRGIAAKLRDPDADKRELLDRLDGLANDIEGAGR